MIRTFGMTVALYSLPFSLFMWYNRPESSYPYEYLLCNLLLGSSINLAILMQCLTDYCKAFVFLCLPHTMGNSPHLPQLWSHLWRCPYLSGSCYSSSWSQKVARISRQLPCFCGQVCVPPEYFCIEALRAICPV